MPTVHIPMRQLRCGWSWQLLQLRDRLLSGRHILSHLRFSMLNLSEWHSMQDMHHRKIPLRYWLSRLRVSLRYLFQQYRMQELHLRHLSLRRKLFDVYCQLQSLHKRNQVRDMQSWLLPNCIIEMHNLYCHPQMPDMHSVRNQRGLSHLRCHQELRACKRCLQMQGWICLEKWGLRANLIINSENHYLQLVPKTISSLLLMYWTKDFVLFYPSVFNSQKLSSP